MIRVLRGEIESVGERERKSEREKERESERAKDKREVHYPMQRLTWTQHHPLVCHIKIPTTTTATLTHSSNSPERDLLLWQVMYHHGPLVSFGFSHFVSFWPLLLVWFMMVIPCIAPL